MNTGKIRSLGRTLTGLMAAGALLLTTVAPVSAHAHYASSGQGGDGQILANGQLHAPFANGVSCGGDPAAFGLETAHHGPDAGTPGKADGCYMTTGGVPPSQDIASPEIR